MAENRAARSGKSTIALFWGHSQLWGTLLWRGLNELGAEVLVLRGRDIARGALQHHAPAALIVPGGWAKQRALHLGTEGREAIREYLHRGGMYVGFCGGAGMALNAENTAESLHLCPCGRKPIADRLVNCSGHMALELATDHPLCPPEDQALLTAPVWWPSQFDVPDRAELTVLARYQAPQEDFWVADLPYRDIPDAHLPAWEDLYGINLNADILRGEPAVLTGRVGAGRYIISYLHLETPGSPQANRWLGHILSWATGQALGSEIPEWEPSSLPRQWDDATLHAFLTLLDECLSLGQRHFLLNWRRPWLLGWRRGLPGFHLSTLHGLAHQIQALPPTPQALRYWAFAAPRFHRLSLRFRDLMRSYLLMERYAATAHAGRSTPIRSGCDEAQIVREKLIGPFPGQGGICGELTTVLENLLYYCLNP